MTNEQRELVERLRGGNANGPTWNCLMCEAATTIEQLAERCERLDAALATAETKDE